MIVIAFAGMAGSGKGEAMKIAHEYDIPVVRMGDLVWEETKRKDLELTSWNVARVATDERKKFGYGIWAKRTIPKLLETNAPVVVIDGVRGTEEVRIFKEEFHDAFMLVAVHASPGTRFKRIQQRKRVDDTVTFEAFESRDKRELDFGLGNVIAMADTMLVNEGDLDSFRASVKEVLRIES